MEHRNEKLAGELQRLAGDFLKEAAGIGSLLTVTDVRMSADAEQATIAFTVFPVSAETYALRSAKRRERAFRAYANDHLRTRRIPKVTFVIDAGEKNRQRIDDLLRGE